MLGSTLRRSSLRQVRNRWLRCFSSKPGGTETTSFGFQDVPVDDKSTMVRGVFNSVADQYDVMNDFMSAGIHRLWKEEFVAMLNPQLLTHPGVKFLDVAGGTGDISFRFVEACLAAGSGKVPDVVVTDINEAMLNVGKRRALERGYISGDDNDNMKFVVSDAEELPFESNSFDVYTIAFGLRNVTRPERALAEAYRVLKPGGHFSVLEFSHLTNPVLQQIYDTYSFNVVPALGEIVVGDRSSYQYLVESIRKFPDQETLLAMMQEAGFKEARYTNFTTGVVAAHSGFKL